jgi:hypothetical protein
VSWVANASGDHFLLLHILTVDEVKCIHLLVVILYYLYIVTRLEIKTHFMVNMKVIKIRYIHIEKLNNILLFMYYGKKTIILLFII